MTLAQIADRNARGDGFQVADGLAAFVALDKAFQRAAKRSGLVVAPYTPSGSVTSRWAVAAATQADIVKIVRLTKGPMAWKEKPDGGWHVFVVFDADLAAAEECSCVSLGPRDSAADHDDTCPKYRREG